MTKLDDAYEGWARYIAGDRDWRAPMITVSRQAFDAGAAAMAELFASGHGLNVKHEMAKVERCKMYDQPSQRRCVKDDGHSGDHLFEFFGSR